MEKLYTDANGNAMLQSFVSEIFKKETGWRNTLVSPLREKLENIFVFLILFIHAPARGGTCAFTSKNCQHADQKQLTRQ